MKSRTLTLVAALLALTCGLAQAQTTVQIWASSENGQYQLSPLADMTFVADDGSGASFEFTIDESTTYQDFLGFGSSFEGSSTYNMSLMSTAARDALIESIVDPVTGIGLNMFRICIGTSDFTEDPLFYTYDDNPPGGEDLTLQYFSIDRDREHIIPALKVALQKNPDILFYASPWSPPAWMKDSGTLLGGNMLDQYFPVYADYLVKFIQAYEAEGIPIYAITPQNEPRLSKPTYPTTYWTGAQERDFIRDHLGPKLAAANLNTKIWTWDHNWDKPERDFPYIILDDPLAKQYVDGTGWHHYAGDPVAMTNVHNAHPDRHQYFTEGSKFGSAGAFGLLEILRNWSRTYNAWVIFLDTNHGPNSGPYGANWTPAVYEGGDSWYYTFDYYSYGQFAKFIQRGAVRIESDAGGASVGSVAYKNPDGSIVTIVVNSGNAGKSLKLSYGGQMIKPTIDAKTVLTFLWASGGATCGDASCDVGENSCSCPIDCGNPPSTESSCNNGTDDDCDLQTDCDDADCFGDPACPSCGDATCDVGEDACSCSTDCGTPPATELSCTDGLDEDCDGAADCQDPTGECDSDPACQSGSGCGNLVCEPGEDCNSCPSDCSGLQTGRNRYCCGNGVVQPAEGDGTICDGNY